MQWGDQVEFFREVEKTGGDTPLRHYPKLEPEDIPLYAAFRRLSAARGYNEGFPQAISISEATGYAKEGMGIRSRDQLCQFLDFVQILDSEFLTFKNQQIKAKIAQETAAAKKG